jgi:hypothetical protein
MVASTRERVEAALRVVADSPAARFAGARPIAIGWATVELDRAAAELAATFGLGDDGFEPAQRSTALGCICRIATGALPDGTSLALLEPDTEGRLAASLARLGEGPTAAWLQVAETRLAIDALRTAGITVSIQRGGPFGPERLIVGGPVHGPHRLLVGPSTGTIRP